MRRIVRKTGGEQVNSCQTSSMSDEPFFKLAIIFKRHLATRTKEDKVLLHVVVFHKICLKCVNWVLFHKRRLPIYFYRTHLHLVQVYSQV